MWQAFSLPTKANKNMKINPNQHYQCGFIQVPLILITIAILTTVGITGNYYIKNNHSTNTDTANTDIATSTEKELIKNNNLKKDPITSFMEKGMEGQDICVLQEILKKEDVFDGTVTCYYGSVTHWAVSKLVGKYGYFQTPDNFGKIDETAMNLINQLYVIDEDGFIQKNLTTNIQEVELTFQDKIKPVISETEEKEPLDLSKYKLENNEQLNQEEIVETNDTKEEARLKIISWLKEDIEELNAILQETERSRERYIDFAEEITTQRKQSLASLLSLAPDNDIKNFIQKGVDNQQKRLDDIRNDYETSFGILGDGMKEYIEKISFVYNQLSIENEVDDLDEYLFGADKEIKSFLNLLQEINKMASNREELYSTGYSKYLGYIKDLNSVAQMSYSISSKLSEIENKISQEPENLEIKCWSTTESIDGIFSGKSQTFIRCE